MNIIEIVSDTFRRDYLGCYGNKWIHTEHIDAFAEKSLVFEKAYIASFPTMPNRADIFTGKYTFTYLGWAPLPRDEVLLAEVLQKAGYFNKAVVDTPFFIGKGYNYDRGFQDLEWIKGQGGVYYRELNLQRHQETDYCAPATMLAASKWLERNYKKRFFLYVDTWDPHEPWDPPRWYADMYYTSSFNQSSDSFDTKVEVEEIWDKLRKLGREARKLGKGPGYPIGEGLTEDEMNRLRALYAGEITMVDRWVGILLQKIEDLGLLENTAVIFTSDHGTYIGEHGYIAKRAKIYEEVGHIPLIIRLPDKYDTIHKRCEVLTQPPDLMPTILDLAGVQIPKTVQGSSLLPTFNSKQQETREFAVSSQALIQANRITVTTSDWSLIVDLSNKESELHHLPTDPGQKKNLIGEKKEVAEKIQLKMVRFLKSLGTKEELLDGARTFTENY